MSLLISAPEGHRIVGWRRLAWWAAAFALAPALLGALALGAANLLGPAVMGDSFQRYSALATLALVSPLLSAPCFAVVAYGGWMLLRRRAFGWLPALALGAAAGAAVAASSGQVLLVPLGAFLALLYRQVLAVTAPEAF